ncbi:hypothetical protein [Streptomyces sp. CAU 1734]|uniref:hypothetical protein n=1 Tax=Streptomyces sp. CAU 1734 TaxID=3140360 RepID=UPI0032616D03
MVELTALLDRKRGWYAVFWQRDPDGMQECLDGVEVPPWDVVAALLQDLAAVHGPQFAAHEELRARRLHASSAAAYDRRPGGRGVLADRVELMRQELIRSTVRAEELIRERDACEAGSAEAERLAGELEWIRDDQARATARLAELRTRLAALPASPAPETADAAAAEAPAPAGGGGPEKTTHEHAPEQGREPDRERTAERGPAPAWFRPGDGGPGPGESGGSRQTRPAPGRSGAETPAQRPAGPAQRTRKWAAAGRPDTPAPVDRDPSPWPGGEGNPSRGRRPGGARFAGEAPAGREDAHPFGESRAENPVPPSSDAPDAPRGARYGASEPLPGGADGAGGSGTGAGDAGSAARRIAGDLARLRSAQRGGEAYAVLCEAAALPAEWLPALAGELERAGLDADWATLLWEASTQPVIRVAAIAGALAAEGRDRDSAQLLRQCVARPAREIAEAVLALEDQGQRTEAQAVLAACVQLHSASDAARIAALDPRRLVTPLLEAARSQSADHEQHLVHALRVAGHLRG